MLGALPLLGLSALGVAASGRLDPAPTRIRLYAQGVVLAADDRRFEVPPRADVRALVGPGTRVSRDGDSPTAARWRAGERALVAAAAARAGGTLSPLERDCLLDLHALGAGLRAPVAGWNARWRYVWPRDLAHVLVTLAGLGRTDDVASALSFLAAVQRPDGYFEARTRLDGTVPDDRRHQSDGAGWLLWAAGRAVDLLPAHRGRLLAAAGDSLDRAADAILADLARHRGLPGASPDYWEMSELSLSLGIAAPLLAGLQSATRAHLHTGPRHGRVEAAAVRLATRIREHFGPDGYRRYAAWRGGTRAGYDASLLFLLPPYCTGFEQDAGARIDTAWRAMRRPAGGVAPGAGWKDADISWTPQTALFAQAWAHRGDVERARDVLDWVDAHRTPLGCVPEKVNADGSPAAVAPLGWTCALIVDTLATLRARENHTPGEDTPPEPNRG